MIFIPTKRDWKTGEALQVRGKSLNFKFGTVDVVVDRYSGDFEYNVLLKTKDLRRNLLIPAKTIPLGEDRVIGYLGTGNSDKYRFASFEF